MNLTHRMFRRRDIQLAKSSCQLGKPPLPRRHPPAGASSRWRLGRLEAIVRDLLKLDELDPHSHSRPRPRFRVAIR